MKRLTTKLVTLIVTVTILGTLIVTGTPITAFAASSCGSGDSATGQILQGVGQTGGSCNASGVTTLAGSVVNILSLLVGVIAVIMIIVSGFRYLTSSGDTNKVASAKSTLIYALVGLAIAGLAQVLVHDVLDTANNAVKTPPAAATPAKKK